LLEGFLNSSKRESPRDKPVASQKTGERRTAVARLFFMRHAHRMEG